MSYGFWASAPDQLKTQNSKLKTHYASSALLLFGLGLAVCLRLTIAGSVGAASIRAGVVFAIAVSLLAAAAGWRTSAIKPAHLAIGLLGAGVLVVFPAWFRLAAGTPVSSAGPLPLDAFAQWAPAVTLVAMAEEMLLRGILFSSLQAAAGPLAAVAVTTIAFGLMHVPLYGWGALPLDLAVGLWLAGLRLVTGTAAAPAMAHVLADLAGWWLL